MGNNDTPAMTADPEATSREELYRQLSQVLQDCGQSATLPPACYADPALFRYDTDTLFRRSWVSAGRADRWKEPGDYGALHIGGVPIFVLRNRDGHLKSFANSCRHRGHPLLQGQGNCKKIPCPFHCWTYDLDGRLIFAPRMGKVPGFDPGDYGLTEFRVAVVDGFVFVALDNEAETIDRWLGDFSSMHTPWDLARWVTTRVREFEVRCNWKAFLEVFNEYYHLPYVHPKSISHRYPEPDPADDVIGSYTTQFGATDGNAALLSNAQEQALPHAVGLTGRERMGTRYTWVYPNLTFAASPDSLWMYEAYPTSAGTSRIVQTVCFPEETVLLEDFDCRAVHYYDRIDTAIEEDIPFLEQQQVGLSSPFALQGRFSPLEPGVANFAYWYADKLTTFVAAM